jgi:hypothetical protein
MTHTDANPAEHRSRNMTQQQNISKLNLIIIITLAGLVLGGVYMVLRIKDLSSQVDLLKAEVISQEKVVEEIEESTAAQLAAFRSQLGAFAIRAQALGDADPFPSAVALAGVDAGYYELRTTSRYHGQSAKEVEYSISHIAVDINYQGFGTKLQAGIARSGLIPIGVYFDYNSDGEVDSDMAIDFVKDLPLIGRGLADAYDPDVAQSLYGIFVMERESANYTSAEDMANATAGESSRLWSYVIENYDALAAWIAGIAEKDAIDQSAPDSG